MRLYVDFNTMAQDGEERVRINPRMNEALAASFRPGMSVVLYDELLEVRAILERDASGDAWWGRPDWSTSRDLLEPASDSRRHSA
jgi:hypothetical protein